MKKIITILAIFISPVFLKGQTGCSDPLANNYNPYATIDDGTCLYSPFIFGCTDQNAMNYNPEAMINVNPNSEISLDLLCYLPISDILFISIHWMAISFSNCSDIKY